MSDIIRVEWDAHDLDTVKQRLNALRGPQARQAMRYAISDATRWASTRAIRGLSASKRIKQAIIRRRVRAKLPTAIKIRGEVWVGVGGIRAIDIGRATEAQIGTYVQGAGGRHVFPHAFIAKMPPQGGSGQHTGVFRRKGRKRLPIDEVRVELQPEAGRILMGTRDAASSRLRQLVERKMEQLIRTGKVSI